MREGCFLQGRFPACCVVVHADVDQTQAFSMGPSGGGAARAEIGLEIIPTAPSDDPPSSPPPPPPPGSSDEDYNQVQPTAHSPQPAARSPPLR
jgi:hypothetical protein